MKTLIIAAFAVALCVSFAGAQSIQPYGEDLGNDVNLSAAGEPAAGGHITITSTNAGENSPGALVMSSTEEKAAFANQWRLVSLDLVALPIQAGPLGTHQASFPIPDDPAFEGMVKYIQTVFVGPGADVHMSNGVRIELGPSDVL